MYNTEIKEKFIAERTDKEKAELACISVFNAVEQDEIAWGADICTRTEQDLKPVLERLVGLRTISSYLRINILKDYVRWCIKNGVSGACDGMLHVEIDTVNKMRYQTVKNPKHLQAYLDLFCDKETNETSDNTIRCYFWLAYAGMKEDDIFRVTKHDVDMSSLVIKFNNVEYPIYREAIPSIRNCINLTRFRYIHPLYGADKTTYKERAPGCSIIRGISRKATAESFRSYVSRRVCDVAKKKTCKEGKTDIRLSYYRAWLSGVFYRVYEGELAGISDTEGAFLTMVKEMKKDTYYHMDSGRNSQAAKHRKLAKEYQMDYERWKMTLTT